MEKDSNKWLSRLLGGENFLKKSKHTYLIIIFVLIGISIMLFSSFIDITEQAVPYQTQQPSETTSALVDKDASPKTMRDYEKLYENQLTEFLTDMLGVNEVTVKVNLDSTEEIITEKNTTFSEQLTKEKDKQGGTRDIKDLKKDEQVVTYRSDSNEKPLILKTLKPKVRGVVIVAKGAENVQIKAIISDAVHRLLDIPPYKIGIYPKYN